MATEDQVKKAFLDALCWDEGDSLAKKEGISPYLILFGGGSFEKLPRTATGFPIWDGVHGPWGVSHAAGRAQFEPKTWAEQAQKLGITDFSPESQDIAAWDLAATVYRVLTGHNLLPDLIADRLWSVAAALHSTWTSLDHATFPERYHAALHWIQGTGDFVGPPVEPQETVLAPFPGYMQFGSRGDDVRELQHLLKIEEDGDFGPQTESAVEAIQRDRKLQIDGICGPLTWAALVGA